MSPFSILPFFLALVVAAPLPRSGVSQGDLLVLQFANVLEQLETSFYTAAIKKFQAQDFLNAGYTSAEVAVEQLSNIVSDESTHTSVLQSTIKSFGSNPITNCNFNFDSALTDVGTTMAVARVVELTGVAAYLGAAPLLQDPRLLAAAASILTIEARHQSILNILSGTGTSIPTAFDFALTPSQVLAIASPFISGCDLGIQANLPITLTNSAPPGIGSKLTFDTSKANNLDQSKTFCQMLPPGAPFAIVQALNNCIVPQINGPVFLFLVNTDQPLLSDNIDQFGSSVVMGPTILFVDSKPETVGQLVRNTNSTVSSSNIISNSQASSIASSAQSTQGASSSNNNNNNNNNSQSSSSSSSATQTASSSSPSASSNGGTDNALQSPGGPNFATGPSPDGKTVVDGLSNLPPNLASLAPPAATTS